MVLTSLVHLTAISYAQAHAAPFRPDYSVFWQAARSAYTSSNILYDHHAFTAAQAWLVSPGLGPRPWSYPPTALLAFLPLAALPFWTSYALWVVTTIAALTASARKFLELGPLALLLLAMCPPLWRAALSGQSTLLLVSLVITAVALLDRRPDLAGALLGVAAATKPQLLVLAPLALLGGRHYRALAASFVTGVALVIVTVALFDLSLWFQWIRAVGGFMNLVVEMGLEETGLALVPWLVAHGLPADYAVVGTVLTCTGAAALVWRIFRHSDDVVLRLIALLGGGTVCAAYAMPYESLLLAPAAIAVLLSRSSKYSLLLRVTASSALVYGLGPVGPLALLFAIALRPVPASPTSPQPSSELDRPRAESAAPASLPVHARPDELA